MTLQFILLVLWIVGQIFGIDTAGLAELLGLAG